MSTSTLPRPLRLIGIIVAAAALSACSQTVTPSPSANGGGGGGGGGTTVDVTLTEFKVELSTTEIPAGEVTFNVTNGGSLVHEFVVFKTSDAEDALPEASDAPMVNEDDPSLESMGEVEDVDPGAMKSFSATLEAGDYVAICNVEGHYDSGMHIHFTVS
jgi:uncharacterized cupredoxin-like copper-binding protein